MCNPEAHDPMEVFVLGLDGRVRVTHDALT